LEMVQAQRRIAVPKSVVQLQRRIRIKCEAQGRRALESAATVLERHFNAYAAHGSGLLSRIEFVKLMREGLEMKPPHYEIAAIMKLYPGPGEHSGRLDQSSFIRDVLQQQKPKGARHGQIEALSATARSDNASTVISTDEWGFEEGQKRQERCELRRGGARFAIVLPADRQVQRRC